jgi:hypothetical protein
VGRTRRRLFLQALIDSLAWSWAAALVLSAVWCLVEPHVVPVPPGWLRWAVAGGAMMLGAVAALVAAWLRSPSALAAALALDARFNLKERVTTSLGLNASEAETAAGRALVADVNNRLMPLRVSERFPIRLTWTAAAVPVCALLLVLLGIFYRPHLGGARAADVDPQLTDDPAVRLAIEQKKKDLLKPAEDRPVAKRPRDPDLKKLDDDVADLAQEPTETKEQANKFIKDAAKVEEAMREAEQAMAARKDAVKNRLNQDNRLNPERLDRKKKDGPAKDLQDAMKDGDFQRASDALKKLSMMLDPEQQKRISDKLDKLKERFGDPGLTKEEKERIQKELDKLNDELLTDEKKKEIQEALNDLEKALDNLAEPEKQEKKLADKLDEQQKQADKDARKRAEDLAKAEEKAKEAQKKADDLAKDPAEQKKLRDKIKELDKKAQEIDQKDGDPKKKDEDRKEVDKQRQEVQKQADDNSKDPAAQKKAEEDVKNAEKAAENQKNQNRAESQKADRERQKLRDELEEMKKNNERINQQSKDELKDLAKELKECDKAMKEGKEGEAAKRLQEAREKMQRMGGDADRRRLLEQIQALQQARAAVCQAMNGKDGNGDGNGDDARGRGVASGDRPLGKDEETKYYENTDPSETRKGSKRITDFLDGPGGERGGRGPAQMTDELRIRAAQEGAAALTRQLVERPSDTERVRGYFDNMRGPEKPAPKK